MVAADCRRHLPAQAECHLPAPEERPPPPSAPPLHGADTPPPPRRATGALRPVRSFDVRLQLKRKSLPCGSGRRVEEREICSEPLRTAVGGELLFEVKTSLHPALSIVFKYGLHISLFGYLLVICHLSTDTDLFVNSFDRLL